MLNTKGRYLLRNFPIVLDPLANVLEVQASFVATDEQGRAEVNPEELKWVQLRKLQVRHDTFSFSLNSSMIHFFGMNVQPERCPFILVYDGVGILRYRLDGTEDGDFEQYPIPAEINGEVILKPTVRISFDNLDDAARYASIIHEMQSGRPIARSEFDRLVQIITEADKPTMATVAKK